MDDFRITPAGDACLAVEFAPQIDEALSLRCAAIARAIAARQIAAVRDVVPTFHTVAVHFDPLRIAHTTLESLLRECAATTAAEESTEERIVEVPVSYGGEAGPDLPAVAAFGGCTEADVIRLHSTRVYRVFMLGFLPGFAYMGQVDERIAVPRLETPRPRVPAGSVAIAGRQTAVYPLESPGGWQIIGRTAVQLFSHDAPEPFLFRPADRVRFVPVDAPRGQRLS